MQNGENLRGSGQLGIDAIRKEWRRPGLRKLPIAATATAKGGGNEGDGQGKGDANNKS